MTAEIARTLSKNGQMKVTFYGKLASILGHELELPVHAPCTVADLRRELVAAYPDAARSLEDGRVRACVASALVGDDHPLALSDEIEFLSPVSGG